MKVLESIINFIAYQILKPMFGYWWAEITFIFMLLFGIAIVTSIIYLIVKNNKAIENCNAMKAVIASNADKNRCLKQDKDDLENTIKYLKSQIEEKDNKMIDLESRYNEKDKEIDSLKASILNKDTQIEELTKKIKKSESAKKAAETRKKNKEKKN